VTKEIRVPLSLTTANAVAAGCAGIGFLALLPVQPSALQATLVMTVVAGAFSTVLLWGANRAAVPARVSAPPATLHNPLTGLATPALADVVLGTEFAAAQRGRPLSVLLVRIEQAREYEARHGAPMRERLLRAAARTVAAHTRNMNLSAHHRSGDATFLLILS
jgi:PleD family two-component response regulator